MPGPELNTLHAELYLIVDAISVGEEVLACIKKYHFIISQLTTISAPYLLFHVIVSLRTWVYGQKILTQLRIIQRIFTIQGNPSCGGQNNAPSTPRHLHILIPGTCDSVRLHCVVGRNEGCSW